MAEPVTGLTPGPANPQPVSFGGIHTQPAYDVIELLPPAAADKLRALRQRSNDAHAVVPQFEQIREASTARVEAEQALKRLTSHSHDGGFNLPEDNRSVIEAQRLLDKATADFKRLTELSEVRTAAWQATSQAKTACEIYLRDGKPGNTTLEAVEVELPKLNKGETVVDAIERHRRRVRELRADLHRIESAPYPSSYAKQRMRAQIGQLAQRGAPLVSSLVEHDREIAWPTQSVQSKVYNAENGAIVFHDATDALALVAWLHRDALIAALDREIASEADDPAALTHEVRQQREAKVMGDLLAVERDESALVWSAMAQSLPVEHRADISAQALLGVALRTVPRATKGPSTSPLAYDIVHPGGR